MNDQDYIRKAVELADGWRVDQDDHPDFQSVFFGVGPEPFADFGLDAPEQPILDALAAQLVRQVDAEPWYFFEQDQYGCSQVWARNGLVREVTESNYPPANRAMNAIRAIVDSGVLS